jgi:hypothetical protein
MYFIRQESISVSLAYFLFEYHDADYLFQSSTFACYIIAQLLLGFSKVQGGNLQLIELH